MIAAEYEAEDDGQDKAEGCPIAISDARADKVSQSVWGFKALKKVLKWSQRIVTCSVENASAIALIVVRGIALEISSASVQYDPPVQPYDCSADDLQQASEAAQGI